MAEAPTHQAYGSEELANVTLAEDTQFIRVLADMADSHALTANEDILSQQGVKVVSRGAPITGRVAEQLLQHKLLKPVEQLLSFANCLSARQLADKAQQLLRELPFLAPLLADARASAVVQRTFLQLALPASLAFKLTVAESERPVLFQHSLLVTIIASWLGVHLQLPAEDLNILALAGVLHDLGELHIDPLLLAPEHQLSQDERRHLYAHPITGFMMLCQQPDIPHAAALVVLQHHERLDGSGYPYRLEEADISCLARYIALADVAATLLVRTASANQLHVLLTLNRQKYDRHLVAALRELLGSGELAADMPVDEAALMLRLIQVGQVFDLWDALRRVMNENNFENLGHLTFLPARLDALRAAIAQAGFDQGSYESLLMLAADDDPEIRAELAVLFSEMAWQLKAVSREIERVRYAGKDDLPSLLRVQFERWLLALHELVGEE